MSSSGLVLVGRSWPALLRGPDIVRWAAIFAFLALGIGLRSPWPADEPRFALAAMDMVSNNHWLLPHRGGEIYADKPPVFMWLQALFFVITGNMRIAFLLPSLLAATATLFLVFDITRRLFGREGAWFAVVALLATVQFTLQAKSAQIDATLMAFTTLGLYGLLRHHCVSPSTGWYALAWLAMGVGIITKGVGFLPMLLLPGLFVAHRLQAIDTRASASWRIRLAPLLIVLPAALWLLPLVIAASAGGHQDIAAYLNELLFRQTVTRYAEGLGHYKPAWYYVLDVIPLLWMPLSLLLIWLVPDWVKQLRKKSTVHWSLLSFAVLALLFFSLSPGKRGVYMLPLLPAVAILAGGSLPVLVGRRAPIVVLRFTVLLIGLVLVVAAAATSFELGPLTAALNRSDMYVVPTMLFLLAVGSTWIIVAMLIQNGGAFTVAAMATWLLLCTWGYALLDPVRSAEQLMTKAEQHLGPHSELAVIGFREQQLLQAKRDIMHWSYHLDPASQAADGARWLKERNDRYLLLADAVSSSCFGEGAGVWLGYRHRKDWRLLANSDIGQGAVCSPVIEHPTRFVAAAVAYPDGK